MEQRSETPAVSTTVKFPCQNKFLVLLVIGILLATDRFGGWTFALWAMLLILPWAVWRGSLHTIHLVVVFLASYLVYRLLPTSPPFLVGKGSGIALYLYFAVLIVPLRRSLDWVRPGKLDRVAAILAVVVVALSAGGLIGWVHFAKPPMGGYARTLPNLSPRLLAVYMGGFAIINALIEEIIWRGVMMTALDTAFGAGLFSVLIQAVSFGLAHYRGGFPSGWIGALLAGLFGLAMGLLRRRTKGLLTSWCVHSAADLVVIGLIVYFAHHG